MINRATGPRAQSVARDASSDRRAASAALPMGRAVRSTVRGIAHFLAALAGYVIALLATAALPGPAAPLAGSVMASVFLWRLAVVGHDAAHGSLTTSAAMNRWIGRFAFLPSLVPYTTWVICHNALHHGFTNLRGRDPMWAPLSKADFDALSPARRALERCYRTLFGVCLYHVVEVGWKTLLFPNEAVRSRIRHRRTALLERLATGGALVAQVGGLLAWQQFLARTFELPPAPAPVLIVTGVVIPFLTVSWWAGLAGFLQHTHPRIRWYSDLAEWRRSRSGVAEAVHVLAPRPVGWLMGHALEHTAHHVDPTVPYPALPGCQKGLEEAHADVVITVGILDTLRILATCKLYDYRGHCWLDYAGRPATAQGRH